MYELDFTEQSQKEIAKLRKSDAQAYKKLKLLLAELREHPYIGTGHPHQLRYVDGMWSSCDSLKDYYYKYLWW